MKTYQGVLWALFLGCLPVISATKATSATPTFHVRCELDGKHGDDPDRVDPKVEVSIITEMLTAAYPQLPADLQKLAVTTDVVVNHRLAQLTKRFGGWGPEDDPEYKFGDATTIKVNVSERFTQFARLATEELRDTPGWKPAQNYFLGFFGHELTHVKQYREHPVRSLESADPATACPEGLCDPGLIEETKKKMGYEEEALLYHISLVSEENLAALAVAYQEVVIQHPSWFKAGQWYGLLGPDFANYYLKPLSDVRKAHGLAGDAKVIYAGQSRCPALVWELRALNNDPPQRSFEFRRQGEALVKEWQGYVNGSDVSQKLQAGFPIIKTITPRFEAEVTRFKKMAQSQE